MGRLQGELFASQSQFILFYPFGFITIFIFESFLFSCLEKIEINKNHKRTKRLSSKVKGGRKILKNGKEPRTHIKKKKWGGGEGRRRGGYCIMTIARCPKRMVTNIWTHASYRNPDTRSAKSV